MLTIALLTALSAQAQELPESVIPLDEVLMPHADRALFEGCEVRGEPGAMGGAGPVQIFYVCDDAMIALVTMSNVGLPASALMEQMATQATGEGVAEQRPVTLTWPEATGEGVALIHNKKKGYGVITAVAAGPVLQGVICGGEKPSKTRNDWCVAAIPGVTAAPFEIEERAVEAVIAPSTDGEEAPLGEEQSGESVEAASPSPGVDGEDVP